MFFVKIIFGCVIIQKLDFQNWFYLCINQIGVLRNFAKFTGKHLFQNLFFNKVAGLRPATLIGKRDSYTGV